ncbi:MAG: DUF4388 domain-containing protein [Pyrinomonadaceae bacterium]|nr:DUF4388 domain-containing protein [Pyrinomonadaceae bacterium]
MQHSRFLVLTGHLNDYPLSDLVGILRHQQKTGRLLIEYPNNPASFFFNDGQLVDAQLDNLSGLQAVCVALAQPPASFNFNPLIRPTRRSIENSLQKVVSELLGCWGDNDLEVEKIAPGEPLAPTALLASSSVTFPNAPSNMDKASPFLALSPAPPNRLSRPFLAMAAVGLLLLGISSLIAVTGGFGKRVLSAAVPSLSHQTSEDSFVRQSSEGLSPNLPKTEFPNNARVQHPIAKGKDAALSRDQSTRQESRNSSINKKEMKNSEEPGAASSIAKSDIKASKKQANEATTDIHSVKVVLRLEGGRVSQASIANHRSGMEAYEALALRIARQRRYPSKGATQEMVTIKVNQPK